MAFFRDVSATTYLHEQLQDEQKDGQQKIEKTYRGIGRIQDSYRERGWRAPKTKQNVLRKISPVFFFHPADNLTHKICLHCDPNQRRAIEPARLLDCD